MYPFVQQLRKLKSFADSKHKSECQQLIQLNADLKAAVQERDDRLAALTHQNESLQGDILRQTEQRQQKLDESLRRRLDASKCHSELYNTTSIAPKSKGNLAQNRNKPELLKPPPLLILSII